MKSLALVAVVVSMVISGVEARQDLAPTGTGVIAGRVTDAATGKPLHASVRVVQVPVGYVNKTTQTDDDGKFEVTGLAAAPYVVQAQAPAHVALSYGQEKPRGPSKTITLADAQHFTTADIALPATSAVEGRIVDDAGQPVSGVIVGAATVMYGPTRTVMTTAGGGRSKATDDQGRFRVEGLAPGDYYLLALSGPFADVDRAGFAPTYFPGTTRATVAQSVHIDAGRDVTDIQFPLTRASLGLVSGKVTTPTGDPSGGGGLVLAPLQGGDVRAEIAARVLVKPDGSFAVNHVPFGQYVMQWIASPARDGSARFGSVIVNVDREAVDDVQLIVAPGAVYRGRFELDDAAQTPPQASRLMLLAAPVDFVNGPFIGFGAPPIRVETDLSFEVSNLFGIGLLRVNAPAPWTVKRITVAGEDVTDAKLDFRKGDRSDVVVTLTTRVTTVTGTVTDSGKAVADCSVMVFPTDASRWTPMSRYVGVTRSDAKGAFSIRGLPPGSYVAVAVNSPVEVSDPQALTKVVPFGTSVSLLEGETHTVALKLATIPK